MTHCVQTHTTVESHLPLYGTVKAVALKEESWGADPELGLRGDPTGCAAPSSRIPPSGAEGAPPGPRASDGSGSLFL